MLIAGMNDLNDAVAFALAAQSNWPASMYMPDGQFVMTFDSGETPPDNEVLGPVTPMCFSAFSYQGAISSRVTGQSSRLAPAMSPLMLRILNSNSRKRRAMPAQCTVLPPTPLTISHR